MGTVSDALAALDQLAPPALCLGNDPRGLLLGDPDAPLQRIVVALDVTLEVARAAEELGAGLVVAHHPLIFHPARTLRADEPFPGRVALACARAGIAVACAHTNWDVAPGGVNDVLADLLGIQDPQPLRQTYAEDLVKVVVFAPEGNAEALVDAMSAVGAGALGCYDRCAFTSTGEGTFRALPGATPHVGQVGAPERVPEARVEMIVSAKKWPTVVESARAAHPYEEMAFDVVPLANTTAARGIGRIGVLAEPVAPDVFLAAVRSALKFDAVRASRLSGRPIARVAVCGGAGAELVGDAIRAGADALVTSDVRHHEYVDAAAKDFLLVDAGHAATETPGTRRLAQRLADLLPGIPVHFLDEAGGGAAV